MSGPVQDPHGAPHGESHGVVKEDRIDFPKVIAVGVVSLVIFALATLWAISILHTERASYRGREEGRVGTEIGKAEIGIVDQVPFSKDERLQVWRNERNHWLNGYDWVDRAQGLVHIPIERAMDALVAGAVPPPPAASGASGVLAPAPAVAPREGAK
jgi:hypothetical protein